MVVQILNQFIHGLCSSILQRVCPMHPATLQDTVTHTRDFKTAELEANYVQAVNLVINESSNLDFKLKHFKDVQPNNLETNQQSTLTSNILPTTVIEDESLTAIFFFEINKLSKVLLFSEAIFEEKPITVMYTNAKVDGHFIKLILNNESAGSIITK
ncbi:hypothetical protein G9A89_009143 [Geosiphon pyriformis]|nr:hypothetical protein G9A89_009143 [Geosiphon pyriformis]